MHARAAFAEYAKFVSSESAIGYVRWMLAAVAAPPPPATAAAAGHVVRMARGSYCWETTCVDMIPPQQRADIPPLRIRRGARVTLRLAFVPTRWSVTIVGSATSIPLPAARTATWLARRGGILDVDARGRVGSASYLVRIVLR